MSDWPPSSNKRAKLDAIREEYNRQYAAIEAEYRRLSAPIWTERRRKLDVIWAEYNRQFAAIEEESHGNA